MPAQNQNQFKQTVVQGQLDLRTPGSIITCEIDASSAGGLVPGQAVKMVDSLGGLPKVVECLATEDIFGFIVYNIKDDTYKAGDRVELIQGRAGCIYMTASSAIARNGKVMVVSASKKVATAVATNMIIGRALDKATADGDMIRVLVDLPGVIA